MNYDDAVAELFPNQEQPSDRNKAIVKRASSEEPTRVAENMRLARTLNTDVSFVERNPKDAAALQRQRKINVDELRTDAPKTHDWYSNYYNAALSIEDAPHLSALEHIGNAFKASGHRLKAGIANDEAFVFNLQSMINQGYRGLGGSLPADHFKTLANDAQQAAHHDNAIADEIAKSRSGLSRVPRVALSGLESIPGTAIALLTGLLTRSPTLGLATFGLPVFGNANQKALDQGLDPVSAAGHGTRQALLETVSESLGFAPLMKLAKGKDGFVKLATEFLGKEMFGEQINTLGSDFEEWVTLPANAGKSFADYAAEMIPHAIDTAIATVAGGGATALTVGGIGKLAKQVRQRSARAVHDKVNDSISAIEGKARIEAMAEAVSKTELNNISPEDMRRFIQHVAPDETVSLSAEDAATFFQSNPEAADALKEHAPEVYAQLAVSEATGSDVKIPMEDYLTSLGNWHEFLNDTIRVGNGAMSYADYEKSSESLMADINAESERAIKDAGSDFNVSAQKVRVNFAQSLTDTGRFTPDVVEKYTELMSSITSSLAARTGMTPEAFAEKYKLLTQTPDRQVQQAQKQADQIDHAIYAIRSGNIPTDSQINGQSLLDFLRDKGGLRDSGGELAARDLKGANKAFQKKLVSDKGNTLDHAAEAAHEAGFLPERDINKLLDAIDSELGGKPVYANANLNRDMEDQSRTIGDVQQRLHDLGIEDISNMSNAEVRDALGADYNQSIAKEYGISEAEAQRQYDAVVAKYKGTDQWMKAPNGEDSKLNERQWVQVRTPAFREWFGEWQANDQSVDTVNISQDGWDGSANELGKLARDIFTKELQGTVEHNDSLGTDIAFTSEGKGEAFSTTRKMKRPEHASLVTGLREIVNTSVRVGVKEPDSRRKHNSRAFHTMISSANINGKPYAIKITIREANKGLNRHKFYDIKEVEIKESPDVHGLGKAEHPASSEASRRSIAELTKQFNIDIDSGVSKVVDENGEPMVVYHGASGDIEAFDRSKIGDNTGSYSIGFYASSSKKESSRYATGETYRLKNNGNVMPLFLNIKNPYIGEAKDGGIASNAIDFNKRDYVKAILDSRKTDHEYDGVITKGRDMWDGGNGFNFVTFNPTQIKSATGNTGQFNGTNGNILFQRAQDHRVLDVSALPDSMDEVMNHTSLAALQGKKGSKEHTEYLAAKNDGDVAAALNVVDRVLKPAVIENIRKQLDPNIPIYVVPVIQREGESLNMIPTAFSERLATALGASVFDSIVKTTGGKNTGKTQADRLMDKHGYEGDIPDQDGQYIIVDDNYTSGNTVVPLIELIQSQGGVVPTLSTLAISRYGKSFKPKQAKLDKLLEQTGLTKNEAGSIIGHDLESLTGTEVQILLNATRQGDGAAKLRGLFASRGEGSKAETASDSNSTRRNSSTNRLNQQNRGSIQFPSTDLTDGASLLTIMETADLSTVIHEMGHFYFEVLGHIATQPDAPSQINEDMTTLLDHLGVDSLDAWNAMSTEERRAMHEQTAEEFEHYILEGKAPSSKLRKLFRNLKAWMLSVYRNSVPRLSHINDDVRAVFDRLIASEDEIAAARQELSANALFTSAEDAGMNDADYAQYLDDIKQTTQLADEALSKRAVGNLKWLEGALGKALKAIQKDAAAKREAMQKEVEADVYSRPVYAAWRYLSRGIVPEGSLMQGKVRLSTAALRDMYGKDEAALWRQLPIRTGKYSMVSKDGIHPDEIAPIFGFDSGDALVRALVEADKPGNVIKAETDRRMLERYGDLVDENAQREAAMESLHNQHSAKVLRAEYAALNKQVGRRDSLTRAALRDYAEAAIGGIKIMDLRPNDYLRAERKAARATAAAFGKGDIAEAAKQKRIQMIQQALYSQAVQTKNASERHVNYLKTFNSPGTRKKIDPDYMDQIDTFLEAFDLRKSVSNKAIRKRQALNVWLDQQKEQDLEPDFNEAILAKKQHYKTLTADELRGVRDAVKQIHHFGKMKHQLLMMEDKRQFDAVVDDAVASIESHAKRTIEPSINEKRLRDSSKKFVREAIFGHRKFSSLIRQLDGYVEGGAMWQLFTRSANARNADEILANRDAGEIILGLMKPYLGLKDKSLTALDSIMRGYSPLESKLAKKLFIPAIGKSLTLEERIAVTLTWGAEVNRERVRVGGFTSIGAMRDEQVQAIIDTLGEEDIHFVKGVWKMMQDKWPDMVQLEKDVSGLTPEQKRSAEIHTKFGKLDGGYYPIVFADEKSEMQNLADMLKDQKRGIYMKAQTKQGHLKATVDGEVQRPLRIDLGVITKHMAQVNHDLAWRKWGLDASRLLRSQRMRQAIASHYSNEFLHEIDEAVKDTIMGDVPAITWSDKALSHVRNGASISAMGFSLITALVQPLGLLQSASRIGGKYMWQGTREYMAGPESMKATAKRVFEASEVMRTRESSMTREVNDVINEAARDGTLTNLKASYFWLIGKTQIYTVDIPTWLGAYQKALDGEFDVDTAVALADQAVLDAQTGGNIKDLARVQRGGPLLKLFTNFYSYLNGTLNLTAEVYHRTNFKSPSSVGAMAVDYVLLFTAPAILATVIFAALRGDGEDDDDMLAWLAKLHLSYMANLFVGVREISGAIEGGYGYSGPAGLRVFGDASNLITQVAQGEPDRAAAKALIKTAGVVFHFPTSQVIRTAEGIEAYAKGEAPITSIAFGKPRNN